MYQVGIYTRLSHDDYSGEVSGSIQNQVNMLKSFVSMMPDWAVKKVYQDDGYSGGSFNRPAFQEMIEDAKNSLINLILVKDLSRFGRNYLDAGYYLQEVLPDSGCRFVSISENIDTHKEATDIMEFMNFVNDLHIKNISKRIKTVFAAKARNGELVLGLPPYGYKKSGDNGNKLVVDLVAAEVVKNMFSIRASGCSYAKITAYLNSNKIDPPSVYRGSAESGSKIWRYRTVKTILTNPAYIGNLCIRKNIKPSIGTNKRIKNDEANWLVTPNTHTAIVDSATWETVQEINEKAAKSFSAPTQQTKEYLFKGLVYCEDCKSPLQSSIEYQTRKNGKKVPYVSYYCSKYSSSGFSICSRHTIYELSLMKLVMKDINNLAGQLIVSKDEIVAKIKKDASAYTKVQFLENSNKLNKLKKEILANENALQKLYEDKITEIISSETFIQLSAEKKAETADLKKQADALELKLKHTEKTEQDITMWIESIKDIMLNSDKPLSREQLLSLIDRIEIGERQVIDGNKIQNVKIIYKQFSETIL